jgi:hypothetical protein
MDGGFRRFQRERNAAAVGAAQVQNPVGPIIRKRPVTTLGSYISYISDVLVSQAFAFSDGSTLHRLRGGGERQRARAREERVGRRPLRRRRQRAAIHRRRQPQRRGGAR